MSDTMGSNEIIVKSKLKDVEIPNQCLAQFCLEKIASFPDLVGMTEPHSGRQYTYGEFADKVKRAASAFKRRGIQKGDIVLIISPNDLDYGVAFLGLTSLGGILTTVNPASSAKELSTQLKDSDATYLITGAAVADKAKEVIKEFKNVKEIFSFGDVEGCTPFSSLLAEDVDEHVWDDVTLDPDDVILLPYSSGTTGVPKGVMVTHRNFIANTLMLLDPEITFARLDAGLGAEVFVMFLPFYHIYGLLVLFIIALAQGAHVIYMPKFDFGKYLTYVQQYKVTVMHIVPPIAVLLGKHPVVDNFDFTSVHSVICGAAPMGRDQAEAVMKRLNVPCVRQGYGMTECLVTHCSSSFAWKHGSAGIMVPNTECKVVDIESGSDLGPNKEGEMWVRSPSVMKGYYKRPEATANTIDKDGWLHTGDICYYDEDLNFYVVDRLKELIKYKAFQVPPAELEALLLTHPGVADVAVIGLPDDEAGELPLAFIVKKGDAEVTADDIKQFVQDAVSPHKRLRGGVRFVELIPKSPSGKILRRILRDELKNNQTSGVKAHPVCVAHVLE